jgi:hypothetical protein
MRFFGLAASFMMPVDELTPFPIHVRDDAKELVLGLTEAHGLIIHAGKKRLFQPFPYGDVAVRLSLLCGALVRDKADFRPLSADISLLVEERTPFFCLLDCFFELGRHIRPYGELNPAETLVAPVAIGHKVMLIACRIGAETYGLHSGRKEREGADEDAELVMSRRDVAVPELGMKDEALFRPVGIQGLVGFEALIGEEGAFLLRFDERGVHVEGSAICGVLFIDGSDQVGIDAFKAG